MIIRSNAIDLYTMLNDKYPDDPQWEQKLDGLVDNPEQAADFAKSAWEKDKENAEKAWKYAQAAIKANMYQDAIVPLEFLVQKISRISKLLDAVAQAYQKTDS